MVLRRSPGFTRQAEDEITMDHEAKVVAVFDEVARALDCGALLDIFEDLRISGLETDDQ